MRRQRRQPESDLRKAVLAYLQLRGIAATRLQCGLVNVGKRWIRMSEAGWPDVVGYLHNGRFFGLELKVGNRQPTEMQEARMLHIRACGGVAGVVRSIEDVEELLR